MKYESALKKLKAVSIGSAMADMALLLLVFFMAATTSEPPKGAEVELPKAVTEGADQDSIYISIASNGTIYVDGEPADKEDLGDYLGQHTGERNKAVSITADKNLSFEQVDEVLEILRSYDFLNVIFMAQPEGTDD
jgi:biopolymer transport protein ExbD